MNSCENEYSETNKREMDNKLGSCSIQRDQDLAEASDAAAAAVAALEAEDAATAVTETKESSEADDNSPITVTVTSGSTQYIAMAGKFIVEIRYARS